MDQSSVLGIHFVGFTQASVEGMNLLIAAHPWCVPVQARPFQKGFDDSIIKEAQ